MKVLILGSNGYLGSKITHALVKEKCNVVCTKRAKSDLSRMEDLLQNDLVKFIPAPVSAVRKKSIL